MNAIEFRTTLLKLGLSQKDLAERLGLALSTVNRWAKNKAAVPQYAVAYLGELIKGLPPDIHISVGSLTEEQKRQRYAPPMHVEIRRSSVPRRLLKMQDADG